MNQELILIEEYCRQCSVDTTFIHSLEDLGLIEIIEVEQKYYISDTQLNNIQRYTEWHYDLDISPAGIDTIQNLLNRMEAMQQEIEVLKTRLRLFE